MATEIQSWQVQDGKLRSIRTSMAEAGRMEASDLEAWIVSDPSVVGPDLVLIGRQTMTKTGPLDLLAVDSQGNVVIVELKRKALPRDALAQALDYASDVSSWTLEKIGHICLQFTGKRLQEVLTAAFPGIDLEAVVINSEQRVILVGFGIDDSLERMVNWLSSKYGVRVNAVLLQYVKTSRGDELLSRTAIMSEELEVPRAGGGRKFVLAMSDVPGTHSEEELFRRLSNYLRQELWSAQRMRRVLFPVLLRDGAVTREQLKDELVAHGEADSVAGTGYFLSLISTQMGIEKNDFLRQVVGYDVEPGSPWIKRRYFLRDGFKDVVKKVLEGLGVK